MPMNLTNKCEEQMLWQLNLHTMRQLRDDLEHFKETKFKTDINGIEVDVVLYDSIKGLQIIYDSIINKLEFKEMILNEVRNAPKESQIQSCEAVISKQFVNTVTFHN